MLEQWMAAAAEEADVAGGAVDPNLLSGDAVSVILDLARHAAHGVERPAAPVSAFVVGLALGRSGGGLADLESLASRLADRAREWPGGD